MLRWASDDALKVSARLNRASLLATVRRASAQRADSAFQVCSLPTIDADDVMAAAGAKAPSFPD